MKKMMMKTRKMMMRIMLFLNRKANLGWWLRMKTERLYCLRGERMKEMINVI
jgi:hypothetical protein